MVEEREYRYGWLMVAISAVLSGCAVGLISSITMFLVPLSADLGWQRGETALAYGIGAVGIGVGGIFMGLLADRFSTRPVVMFGVLGTAVPLYLLSTLESTLELYIYYALLGGLGAAAIFTPMVVNVGYWFHANKGLALGISTAAQSAGHALFPFAISFLIVAVGWRDSYLALSASTLAVMMVLALFVRVPPGHAERMAAARAEETRTASAGGDNGPVIILGWLSVATIFCCITMATPLMHVTPLALDKGFAADQAATVYAVVGLSAIIGRILYGKLADRIGGIRTYLVGSTLQTALVFWYTQIDTIEGLYFMSVAYGLGFAGVMTSIIIVIREHVPVHRQGVAMGVVGLLGWLGMGVGGYQAGYLYDLSGGYAWPFGAAVLAGVVNMALVAGLHVFVTRRDSAAVGFSAA